MWSPNPIGAACTEYSPLSIEAQFHGGMKDDGQASCSESRDVLEEENRGICPREDSLDFVPQPPLVCGVPSLPCGTERLARDGRSDRVHSVTPRLRVECGNVIPDRGLRYCLRFHPRHEGSRGRGIPLDIAYALVAGDHERESDLFTTNPGT